MSDDEADLDLEARIDELVDRAETLVADLSAPDEERTDQEVLDTLEDLKAVADEAEDIISTVDVTELLGAIDASDLPDAVEVEDIPDAIAEGDPDEAVTLRKLFDLTDLPALFESVNAREFWREKREFDDAVDELTGDDDDGGLLSDDGADEDEDSLFGDDGSDGDDRVSMGGTGSARDMDDYSPEAVENAVQSKVSDAVGEFRKGLLRAHERLAKMRERNRERSRQVGQPNSRNPTAFSTMSSNASSQGDRAKYSTVPEETKYSTAPNRRRIYGSRFEDARGGDDE